MHPGDGCWDVGVKRVPHAFVCGNWRRRVRVVLTVLRPCTTRGEGGARGEEGRPGDQGGGGQEEGDA